MVVRNYTICTGIILYLFFRNPNRRIPHDPMVLVSPADGKVMEVVEVFEDTYLHQQCKKVTIFLSVFDVHVNRAPWQVKLRFDNIQKVVSYLPIKIQ